MNLLKNIPAVNKIGNKKIQLGLVIVISIIGIIVLFVVTRKIKTFIALWKDARDNKTEQQVLELQGVTLSYSKQWYEALARRIYNAANWTWYDWNCDEITTQAALTKLKTDLDYLELISAFGTRDGYDMNGFIDSCLNDSEKEAVNNVWSGRGMKKRL